jgi:hypothetical protein
MKLAVIIGVESYADSNIARRTFAATDAAALALALQPLGFAEQDQLLLVDAQATRTTIESKLRRLVRGLEPEDQLIVYYAGHGFTAAGQAYLTCHDSQHDDLTGTSIAWSSLLSPLRAAACAQTLLLIDSDAAALASFAGDELVQHEFEAFASQGPSSAVLLACGPTETSWPAPRAKQSAWTAALLTALTGKAKAATNAERQLTLGPLREYLSAETARLLQKAYSEEKPQSPVIHSDAANDQPLFDLSELATRAKQSLGADPQAVMRVTLWRETTDSIRSLSGFKKTQAVPDAVNSYARQLVEQAAAGDVERDIAEIRDLLRQHFAFKRRDLEAVTPGDGTGSILTPYFSYSLTISLNPANPGEVITRRQVTDVKDPDQLLSKAFEHVFQRKFNAVEFRPPQPISLTDFIDELEEADDPRVKLDYDAAATWVKLKIRGVAGEIDVSPTNLAIVQAKVDSPRVLLEAFFKIQTLLADTLEIRTLGLRS